MRNGFVYDCNLFYNHLPEMTALTVAKKFYWRTKTNVVELTYNSLREGVYEGEEYGNISWLTRERTSHGYGARYKSGGGGIPVLTYNTLPKLMKAKTPREYLTYTTETKQYLYDRVCITGLCYIDDMCVPSYLTSVDCSLGCNDLILPRDDLTMSPVVQMVDHRQVILGGKRGDYGVLRFFPDKVAQFDAFGDGVLVWEFPWYSKGDIAKLQLLRSSVPVVIDSGRVRF